MIDNKKHEQHMNRIKRIMGLMWIIIAPAVIYFLVMGAVQNVSSSGTKDINKPVPWIIIISIFTPIAIGLMVFGYYAFRGEYDKLPESSEEL
jgi:purine-cytosine permease-like protein